MVTCPSCLRCRKQKLKCSRDTPSCTRCRSISAICDYPAPPDRKALAEQRIRKAKANTTQSEENATVQSQHLLPVDGPSWNPQHLETSDKDSFAPTGGVTPFVDAVGHQHREQSNLHNYQSPFIPSPPTSTTVTLPSSEVAVFLLEIYFSRLYNASLLFHKKTFLVEYAANKVPDFVALSIFALASIFLRQPLKQSRQESDENVGAFGISMLSAVDSTNQGLQWATAASQKVLMLADIPRLETIQACQNLALYWFSVGQTDRTYMHTHIAYKTARLLNFPVPQSFSVETGSVQLSRELERRCFWSCWITSCISQDNAAFKSDPWREAVGLLLPSDEESWASEKPISMEFFDGKGNIGCHGPSDLDLPHSAMGELVKLFCLWWEIQHFVNSDHDEKSNDPSIILASLFALDRRLKHIFESFHPRFRNLDARSFPSQSPDTSNIFTLHILYHLCACVLHSSIVPLFSNRVMNSVISKNLVKLSVEESMTHAALILDTATLFLENGPDAPRLPSITGYAVFVAITVHFKSLVAQRRLQISRMGRFKAAVSILECLKEYWATLQELWYLLKALFVSNGIDIDLISTSNIRPQKGSDERPTDVEQFVSREGATQGAGGIHIFTYVGDQAANRSSSQHPSESSSHARSALSPDGRPIAAGSAPRGDILAQELGISPTSSRSQGDHPISTFPPQHSPLSRSADGTDQLFTHHHPITQHHIGRMDAGPSNQYPKPSTAEEEFQRRIQSGGFNEMPVAHTMAGLAAYSEAMDTRMIEGVDFWWNQSFDMDANQLNQVP